jgi:hypothetical protein
MVQYSTSIKWRHFWLNKWDGRLGNVGRAFGAVTCDKHYEGSSGLFSRRCSHWFLAIMISSHAQLPAICSKTKPYIEGKSSLYESHREILSGARYRVIGTKLHMHFGQPRV